MDALITNGIKISVETFFQPGYSDAAAHKFVFAYRITIENTSQETVQLLRRHWFIKDANSDVREVEGEGVIGKQPVIAPGQAHQYVSWCDLSSEIGKMYGTYLMRRDADSTTFKAAIPEFTMIVPYKLN